MALDTAVAAETHAGERPAIVLRGVTKRFPGTDHPAVTDLSLEIPRGSTSWWAWWASTRGC